MTLECGVAGLLRAGGPVRVPLRACCAAALVGRDSPVHRCDAAPVADVVLDPSVLLDASGVAK